jgi:transposase
MRGMKPYPIELRQRIVDAVDQQRGTIAEIAEWFRVSERYVYHLLHLRRTRGELAPQPHGGGARAKLDESKRLKLASLTAEFPDATLEELRQLLRRRCRVQVCLNTVWRALQRLDWTLKKRAAGPGKPPRRSAPPLAKSS